MVERELNGLRVAILATDGFEESELLKPQKALQAAGAETEVVAPKPGEIRGMRHDEKGVVVPVDRTLEDADPGDFDALLLPGGTMNADALRVDVRAQEFVAQIDKAQKPIGVICHGPWLLVSAGLVKGRRLTSFFTIKDDLKNAGAYWEDQEVLRDGNWVSSRKPSDIPAFNREFLRLISEQANKRERAA